MSITKGEILKWLDEHRYKDDVKEITRWLVEEYDYDFYLSLSKADLLEQLGPGGPQKKRLLEAIEEVLEYDTDDIEEDLADLDEDDDWDEDIDDDDDDWEDEDDGEDEEWDWAEGEWELEQLEKNLLYERMAAEVAFSEEHAAQPARPYQEEAGKNVLRKLKPGKPALLHIATGGGKTRVANDTIVEHLKKRRSTWVLWLAPSWELLYQAARDLARRHEGYEDEIARIGGDRFKLPGVPEDFEGARVCYTTTHTLVRRVLDGYFVGAEHPSLVVWDECHLGETRKTGKVLFDKRRWKHTPILGLTATPRREEVSHFSVVYSKSFSELVHDGYLAKPLIRGVGTNVKWRPQFMGNTGLLSGPSLRELAENEDRNQLIIDHYAANANRYGKTLVFCCGVDHAEELAGLFASNLGVPARSVSYKMTTVENEKFLREFSDGEVHVVTNMAKLTHGVDIPDIQTVFLCRPTTSDILFSQMIGRGCRRVEEIGKNTFNLVEFTDNVQVHGDVIYTAKRYFQGATAGDASRRGKYRPVERLWDHRFDPRGRPTWIPDDPGVPADIRGLWYRQDQTFGIEFELTSDGFESISPKAWIEVAEFIRSRLSRALPGRVAGHCVVTYGADKDNSHWNVVSDSSCGWEVTSRVLKNRAGFEEVIDACAALEQVLFETGLKVNFKTGTHVHLGWLGKDLDELVRAIRLARLFEPAMATLVTPSRVVAFEDGRYDTSSPNEYCRPLSSVITERTLSRALDVDDLWEALDTEDARYTTFNIVPLSDIHTVEVRLHNGTVEAKKILLWISLWQQLLWAAANRSDVEAVPDREFVEPTGDIVALARTYLPRVQQPGFVDKLLQRREEVVERWRQHPDLAHWLEYAEDWR